MPKLAAMKRSLLRLLERARLLRPAYRVFERLQSLRGRGRRVGPDGLPVPPPRLIVRVTGTADRDWFLESGKLGADAIRDALARNGIALEAVTGLLDFGCGCGRVTRYWRGLDGTQIAGTDLDARAVEWCRRNLPFARFDLNGLAPPLPFEDGSFELVYALSVFTHLSEELQHDWTRELRRVLRPAGHLLITTHGDAYAGRLTPAERERYDRGDVVVRWEDLSGLNLCAAFHPQAYLRSRLADGFAFVDFAPEGAKGNPRQDLSLLRKE
jgi:SAM-dependent methyltransferase